MVDHDHSYKLLFAHPEMVRDLLQGFVRGEWIARLDLGTLERMGGTYVSDDLRTRASDIYLLIDERRYDDRELAASGNLVATLFRLEHACRRDQIREVANALMEQLASAGLVGLRRAFGVWLDRVFRARLMRKCGEEIDELMGETIHAG